MDQPDPPPQRSVLRAFLKIGAIVALILGVNYGLRLVAPLLELKLEIRPDNAAMVRRIVVLAAGAYVLTLAIPFVPGVEIGMGLMMVLGVGIVPLVYGCTVLGLTLAFLTGRLVPASTLIRFCTDLGLSRLAALLSRFDTLPPDEKLPFLAAQAPNRLSRILLSHRYLAIAAVVNLPGNFLMGGGGGIAMLAGGSRLFAPPLFLLTIALAVAPVPVAMLIFGTGLFFGG